jgi:CheY-like chemotaxis protein
MDNVLMKPPGEKKDRRPTGWLGVRLRGLFRPRMPRPAILVIDDEPSVRELLRRVLEPEGYTVLTAESGAEALRIWERAGQQIRLVISDVVMAGMDGPETVLLLGGQGANVPVLYMSAYPRERIPHQDRYTAFIQKPFAIAEIVARTHALIEEQQPPPPRVA